ncbi:hemolysin D [Salimicrobium jeotgali]|uniref:Hemolysin D n=1 Tax=Salimicrobium jeotgali TaxID=1230341 RepID=K2FLD2_9BACI|nr:hemolysin III family protein [Salimicrobium jeotgali]AKG04709.1 hemolysin D [Salimicrobium jeotgali]EKE31791.1 hemolysin III family protein [Salimicrobium jeotgali]MBM7696247.1 hemolysin III [Salimicrobium jeotgali]
METHIFSKKEELANAITHGIGAVLSIAMLVLLVTFSSFDGNVWTITSSAVYGATMLLLFLSSTLVHSFPQGKIKDLFEIFDHASIYLFIAGTYTPILLIALGGKLGWTLFGIVWGAAVVGVVFKIFFVKKFVVLSTLIYVLMGWMIVIAWDALTASLAPGGVIFLVAGGLAYTVGALFYVWRGFTHHHMIWHLFVLAGAILHFVTVFFYII